MTWGKSSALVGTTVLQLHDSVVITVAELVPGAAEPPAYAMWLYDRAAAGGCCPAEDASVVELLAHSHRRLVCAPSDDADPEAPPTYTTADAGIERTAAAAAAAAAAPPYRDASLEEGAAAAAAAALAAASAFAEAGNSAAARAPALLPERASFAPFGADRLLAFDGGAGFAATDAEHVRVWTLQRGVAPEAWGSFHGEVEAGAAAPEPERWALLGQGTTGRRRATRRRAPRARRRRAAGGAPSAARASRATPPRRARPTSARRRCTRRSRAPRRGSRGMLTSCADCAVVDGCGWCGADGQCVADYDDGRASHCKGPEREYVNDVGKCDAGLNDQRRGRGGCSGGGEGGRVRDRIDRAPPATPRQAHQPPGCRDARARKTSIVRLAQHSARCSCRRPELHLHSPHTDNRTCALHDGLLSQIPAASRRSTLTVPPLNTTKITEKGFFESIVTLTPRSSKEHMAAATIQAAARAWLSRKKVRYLRRCGGSSR